MNRVVLILGATSSIARAVAAAFGAQKDRLFLAARDEKELARIAADLKIRYGVDVACDTFDAEDVDSHRAFLTKVHQKMGALDGVVVAFGDMGDHKKGLLDFREAATIIQRNYIGACSVLTYAANDLAKQGSGFIVGITSVAADRGRQSNYIYGSAKAGLMVFLAGLRNRLYHSGVHVMTVKPGFVDTAMTFGLPGLFLVADPQMVGKKIVQALEKKKNVLYIPWYWRFIMGIIRSVPESLFKRLKL